MQVRDGLNVIKCTQLGHVKENCCNQPNHTMIRRRGPVDHSFVRNTRLRDREFGLEDIK